jgi:hypothetical protein
LTRVLYIVLALIPRPRSFSSLETQDSPASSPLLYSQSTFRPQNIVASAQYHIGLLPDMGLRSSSRLLFLLLFAITATAKCYYPNGAEAEDDLPCDADAENSVCCNGSAGSICLSNKLCSGPNGNILRGSCTDKDWLAPECASLCLGMASTT